MHFKIPFREDSIPPLSGVTEIKTNSSFFSYDDRPEEQAKKRVWYLNFADRNLFGYYNGSLFAQDEMQVMEHPILGSIRYWLEEKSMKEPKYHPNTQDAYGSPTPFLFQNIERRVVVATDSNVAKGRPKGSYGNKFAHAPIEVIKSAVTFLQPPTHSNILAISAISPRHGRYTLNQINKLFSTLYTGFMAARIENVKIPTEIHTGNWGCGAFGGNPCLIALLQITAANCAGIDTLFYHPVSNQTQFDEALNIFLDKCKLELEQSGVSKVLGIIEKLGFEWGVSDGN